MVRQRTEEHARVARDTQHRFERVVWSGAEQLDSIPSVQEQGLRARSWEPRASQHQDTGVLEDGTPSRCSCSEDKLAAKVRTRKVGLRRRSDRVDSLQGFVHEETLRVMSDLVVCLILFGFTSATIYYFWG